MREKIALVSQTDIQGNVTSLITDFVDLMTTRASTAVFAPGLGSIIGATWAMTEVMVDTYKLAAILSLASTLNGRIGARIEIYAGLATRP